MIVATDANMITAYKISDNSKSYSVKIPVNINMMRLDYMSKRLLVSSDKEIFVVDHDKIEKTIHPKVSKFNFIFPLHGLYFVASKDGNLYRSHQMTFDSYQ